MDEFMAWCRQALGIRTSLVIKEFDYVDYVWERDRLEWDDFGDEEYEGLTSSRIPYIVDIVVAFVVVVLPPPPSSSPPSYSS